MRAALSSIRSTNPRRLVCAVPVAAPESLGAVEALCDDIVCLAAPDDLYAVGQFYENFQPVDDADVIALLDAPAGGGTSV